MTINCISCGHQIDLGNSYDDYYGQVRCWVCGALLEIKTEDSSIKMMKLAQAALHATSANVVEQAS